MKRFFKTFIPLLLCCMIFWIPGLSQEVLVPALPQQVPSDWGNNRKSSETDYQPDTIELPFLDDFSARSSRPDRKFWTDEDAFINNSYTRDQITIGVATLDAVDSKGKLNGSGDIPFESDYLTSLPINLEYPGRDDIYLSFYYQPGGLGDTPEEGDSLLVDFWVSDSSVWETVWSHMGHEADSFIQVYIHVQENKYLKKGFRFRFKNLVSLPTSSQNLDLTGNVDHWHIDYVYLDTSRNSSGTAIHDVSMISPLPSLLKSYESIPWTHFPKARIPEIESTVSISYRNNDTTIRNVTRILKITDLNYQVSDSVNGGAANVNPLLLNQFKIPFVFPFSFYESDSTIFEVLSYLITETQDFKANDTVMRHQLFSNYYSYDDGSAENGYGLRGEGTLGGMVAYRFKTYNEDTLRALQIYFNRTLGQATDLFFRIAVWDHDETNNRPGDLLYSHDGSRPVYSDELNAFSTYELDTILVLKDEFYVGWIKSTETILNVGFDNYINSKDKIFYNIGQDWINTSFSGSLMLRPVMGKKILQTTEIPPGPEPRISIYPNPATEYFQIEWPPMTVVEEWELSLMDLHGRIIYSSPGRESLHNIGHLTEGIYILQLTQKGIRQLSRKLMIIR
jgi:hypothetical protein